MTASALDMAPNLNTEQSAFVDTFSLTTASSPSSELLENNNLEIAADRPDGWLIEEGEGGTARYEGFASRSGANGFWIAPRSASTEPLDARFTQTIEGTAGAEYTFSGWSFWETDYSGGVETLDPATVWGAIPSDTETSYFIEFLDEGGLVIDTAEIDLRTVQANDRTWREHGVSALAPEGTVEVKVGVLAESLRTNRTGDPFDDAYFDDFSLTVALAGLAGDYNDDGVVDAADYTVWRDDGSPDSSQAGYDAWANNYGATNAAASQAIPKRSPSPPPRPCSQRSSQPPAAGGVRARPNPRQPLQPNDLRNLCRFVVLSPAGMASVLATQLPGVGGGLRQ